MLTVYAKLFSRITESSLMEEPIPVRYAFVLLLAISDPKGYVIGTDVAIARRINMPLADFKAAVRSLMQADEDSNSKEEEGKRIVESDTERGYKIVNYMTYRDARDADGRREYMRTYMKEKRDSKKPLARVSTRKPPLAQAEAEVKEERESKTPALAEVLSWAKDNGVQAVCAEKFFHENDARPLAPSGNWKDVKGNEIANWRAKLRSFSTSWVHNDQERTAKGNVAAPAPVKRIQTPEEAYRLPLEHGQ